MNDSSNALLGLEAHAALAHDARLFQEVGFLGSVHASLQERLGPDDAAATLLQLGFVCGLRDASEVVRAGLVEGRPDAAPAPEVAPRLRIEFQPATGAGALELAGGWRERLEAEARLATLGLSPCPACHLSAGYTSGWLSAMFERDILAVERECAACGHPGCRFEAREAEAWSGSADPAVRAALAALDFPRLWEQAGEIAAERPADPMGLDGSSPAIHLWGPVMVVPFAGGDEVVAAVELIGADPEAREVSVVVVDLAGAILDEGFGALALERILDAIEGWGAEPLLTGVSPLAEAVLGDLAERHLLVCKDLPEAIGAAFQIADSQRRLS